MKRLRASISTTLRIGGGAAVFRLRAALLMFATITRLIHLRAVVVFAGRLVSTSAIFVTRRMGRAASAIARVQRSASLLVLLARRVHLRTALRLAGILRARRIVLRTLHFATRLVASWFFTPGRRVVSAAFGRRRRFGAGRFSGFGFLRGQRCATEGKSAAEQSQWGDSRFHGSVWLGCGELKPSSVRTVSERLTPPRRFFVLRLVTKAFHAGRIVRVAFVRAPA